MKQPMWDAKAAKAYETGQGVELVSEPHPHYAQRKEKGHTENCMPLADDGWNRLPPSHSELVEKSLPQRKPLTDTEILLIWKPHMRDGLIEFARAIEAAHGITGES